MILQRFVQALQWFLIIGITKQFPVQKTACGPQTVFLHVFYKKSTNASPIFIFFLINYTVLPAFCTYLHKIHFPIPAILHEFLLLSAFRH